MDEMNRYRECILSLLSIIKCISSNSQTAASAISIRSARSIWSLQSVLARIRAGPWVFTDHLVYEELLLYSFCF